MAGELRPGYIIECSNGKIITVAAVDDVVGARTVYNFEVEEFHTYFVGKMEMWVHNECDGMDLLRSPRFNEDGNIAVNPRGSLGALGVPISG